MDLNTPEDLIRKHWKNYHVFYNFMKDIILK
jgi:hypothetical protein